MSLAIIAQAGEVNTNYRVAQKSFEGKNFRNLVEEWYFTRIFHELLNSYILPRETYANRYKREKFVEVSP